MKKILTLLPMIALLVIAGCDKVPAGYEGVKVVQFGPDKGVKDKALTVGRYFCFIGCEIYTFPSFQQTHKWSTNWSNGNIVNGGGFSFQTKEGLSVSANIGITYHIETGKSVDLFKTYRRGVDEITNSFLRNTVQDTLVREAGTKSVEYVYGSGKSELLDAVLANVRLRVEKKGLIIDEIFWDGRLQLPTEVKNGIDAKIQATQIAAQRENEIRTQEAQAKKRVIDANAERDAQKARTDAVTYDITQQAKAQAEANRIIANSVTEPLIKYEQIRKWNGILPQVQTGSGSVPLINIPTLNEQP